MEHEDNKSPGTFMSRRTILLGGTAIIATGAIGVGAMARRTPADETIDIVVHKTPTCGCCGGWVSHITDAGMSVRTENHADLTAIRQELGAPGELASCHIAIAEGYVVEGHIPADAIRKLLTEKPDAVGIFVPGMPLGSPGMESPRGSQPYDVILLRRDGTKEIFASYG